MKKFVLVVALLTIGLAVVAWYLAHSSTMFEYALTGGVILLVGVFMGRGLYRALDQPGCDQSALGLVGVIGIGVMILMCGALTNFTAHRLWYGSGHWVCHGTVCNIDIESEAVQALHSVYGKVVANGSTDGKERGDPYFIVDARGHRYFYERTGPYSIYPPTGSRIRFTRGNIPPRTPAQHVILMGPTPAASFMVTN